MLNKKQEVLSNIVSAYISSSGIIPEPSTLSRIKVLAESVLDFGADDRSDFPLPASTPLSHLSLSTRARSAIVSLASRAGLGRTWDDVSKLPADKVEQVLDEMSLGDCKNSGLGTIREIKVQFSLCGLQIRPRME